MFLIKTIVHKLNNFLIQAFTETNYLTDSKNVHN